MIITDEAVYRFKLEFDKLDSKAYPALALPAILILLNRAQNRIIKDLYTPDNKLRTGVEGDQLRRDQFSSITIIDEPLVNNIQKGLDTNQFFIDLTELKKPYLHYISGYALCSRGPCKNVSCTIIEYSWNDKGEVNRSVNNNANFDWEELPGFIAGNKLYLYSDGEFTIDSVSINYIKTPIQFDLEGYTRFDNTPSQTVNSDLPDFMIEDIITEAVTIATAAVNKNTDEYQIAKQESTSNNI